MDAFTIKLMEKVVKARTLLEQMKEPSCKCGFEDDPESYAPCKCGAATQHRQLRQVLSILAFDE